MYTKLLHLFTAVMFFWQILLYTLLFIGYMPAYGQQYAYIDFGSSTNTTIGNWNNVIVTNQNQTGLSMNLIDDSGANLGIVFTLSDSFDFINTSGTTSPNNALPFQSSATRDSFFGATNSNFNGNINPTGGFTLSKLDPNKFYSFSVFSSRMGVSDNRETLFTTIAATTNSQTLNPANNTKNTADILNIQPNERGEIIFQAEPGFNNNNSNGFYYLGAVKLVISNTPISDITSNPELTLVYPNGGHVWEVDKIVRIKWESVSISDIIIEFSSNNGFTWNTVASVPSHKQYYDMIVPSQISSQCMLRVSGDGLTDTTDTTFEIILNEGVTYKIIVLGSSTAAGTGPSNINNAWVWKYTSYLAELDTRYELINLALGGFATYNILPTASSIPDGVNRSINTERNITKAIELNANGIIINLPSNDAASGYSISNQLNNYSLISNETTLAEIPLWVTTPQPRNFGTNTTKLSIQLGMIDETHKMFTDNVVDFWTGFEQSNENGILLEFDSGDGVHMNDDAHQIFYERIISKNIHTQVKNIVDTALDINENKLSKFSIFPNPISSHATLKFIEKLDGMVKISIYNIFGQEVEKQNYKISNGIVNWSKKKIQSGIYLMNISYESKLYQQKLIIN